MNFFDNVALSVTVTRIILQSVSTMHPLCKCHPFFLRLVGSG